MIGARSSTTVHYTTLRVTYCYAMHTCHVKDTVSLSIVLMDDEAAALRLQLAVSWFQGESDDEIAKSWCHLHAISVIVQ